MDKSQLIKELKSQLGRNELVRQSGVSNFTVTKYARQNVTELGRKIIELREQGKSIREIAKTLKCSKSTVSSYSYLIDPQNDIRFKNLEDRVQHDKAKSLLNRELKWLKAAKKRAYKGSYNYQMPKFDYKMETIAICGGKCMRCGGNEGLCFHHIDPSTKKFNLNAGTRISLDEWVKEVNKCCLLCASCHIAVHKSYETDLQCCNIKSTDFDMQNCDINKLAISNIDRTTLNFFCDSLHYLGESNKEGIASYGFYIGQRLIAIALITNPVRSESAINNESTCELSRFLIIGKYRRKNMASKCLSMLIKRIKIDLNYKWLISFADTSLHEGTIYKAANFHELGNSNKGSYNYEGIHKKTIYERAKRLDMTEYEYARFFNLQRNKESPKAKFAYCLE